MHSARNICLTPLPLPSLPSPSLPLSLHQWLHDGGCPSSETVLSAAAGAGHEAACGWLIQHGALAALDRLTVPGWSVMAAREAAYGAHLDLLDQLFSLRPFTALDRTDDEYGTVLEAAARSCDCAALQRLYGSWRAAVMAPSIEEMTEMLLGPRYAGETEAEQCARWAELLRSYMDEALESLEAAAEAANPAGVAALRSRRRGAAAGIAAGMAAGGAIAVTTVANASLSLTAEAAALLPYIMRSGSTPAAAAVARPFPPPVGRPGPPRDLPPYYARALLTSAVSSHTPDWRDKAAWLLAAGVGRADGEAFERVAALPDDGDALQRLEWMAAQGCGFLPLRDASWLMGAASEATRQGNLCTLEWLMGAAAATAGEDMVFNKQLYSCSCCCRCMGAIVRFLQVAGLYTVCAKKCLGKLSRVWHRARSGTPCSCQVPAAESSAAARRRRRGGPPWPMQQRRAAHSTTWVALAAAEPPAAAPPAEPASRRHRQAPRQRWRRWRSWNGL